MSEHEYPTALGASSTERITLLGHDLAEAQARLAP